MKLCWFLPDDRGGGVVSVALSCVRAAHAAGHEATLLLLHPSAEWLASETRGGCRFDTLGLENPAAETPAVLLRWLREHPQDVFILNCCEQAEVAIPYLPGGTRFVYVVHDTAARYWRPALAYEDDIQAVVAVSQVVADQFKNRLREPGKLRVIHNGSFFPPPPEDASGGERPGDLLFLGGDNPTKGAADVLRLWACLARDGFGGSLHWFGELDAGFRARVLALPGAERIRLHGRAPRGEIFATAARCRVFLMLSRVEPFGMATIEAMSMGAVPVAWDVATGTREIVRANETGLFVPLGDFPACARAVAQAARDHARLSPAAARDARTRFGEEAMGAGYARLITDVAAGPAPARSRAGQEPPLFTSPRRHFQILPARVRRFVRLLIGASPRLGYWLRDMRGL